LLVDELGRRWGDSETEGEFTEVGEVVDIATAVPVSCGKSRFEYGKKDGKLTTKAKSKTTPVRERGWGCASNESDGSA